MRLQRVVLGDRGPEDAHRQPPYRLDPFTGADRMIGRPAAALTHSMISSSVCSGVPAPIPIPGSGPIAGAVMIERAIRMAVTVNSASTGADKKLKSMAGCVVGSADVI